MSVAVEPRPPELPVAPVTDHRRRREVAVVAIPTALALALCLYDLTARNLWLDEAASITIALQHGSAFGSALAHDGGNMLGFYGLLHLLIGAFGDGSLVARLPSALASAATVGLTSMLALRLFDRRIALLSGLIAAVSLPLVYWGQDARGYTLMVAFVTASFLLLVIGLQQRPGGRWIWVAYAASITASVYLGLEAVLVIAPQLVVLIWHRRHVLRVLTALIASGICCIPLAVLAANRGSAQIFWIPLPNAFTTKQVLLTLSSGGLEPQFYSATGDALRLLTEVVVGIGLLALIWQLWSRSSRRRAWRPALVLAWLVIPPALSWVISELGHSMFEARYLLVSLPAVALLEAWMIVGMWDLGAPRVSSAVRDARVMRRSRALRASAPAALRASRVLAVVLLGGFLTLRAMQLIPSYGVSTEPWRTVTREVVAGSRPGDCVAFYPLDSRMPFRYYLPMHARAPVPVLPNLPWNRVRPFVEVYATLSRSQLARLPSHCGRVWLISSHQGHHDGTPVGIRHFERFQTLKTGLGQEYLHSSSATFGAVHIITVQLFSTPRSSGSSPPPAPL